MTIDKPEANPQIPKIQIQKGQGEFSLWSVTKNIFLAINLIINYHVCTGIALHKRLFVRGPASVDRDFAKDETKSNTINHHVGLVTQC